MAEQLVETPKNASRDRIQHRNVERIVDDPVPEVDEELVARISLRRDQQPFCGGQKVVEVSDIQTRGKTQQGVNIHIQHVVDTVDAEDHIIQEKINQMTKHIDVPGLQIVERTVRERTVADR